MRVLKGFVVRLVALCLMIIGVFALNGNVFAVDEVPDYRIQISPASISVDLTPGKTTTAEFRVQNTGSKDFDFKLLTGPYSVEGENYEQNLSAETAYTYIKDWITFSVDSGSLKAGEEKEITAKIEVPSDAPSGGQYGVIYARMLEPAEGGNIKYEQQVGMILYSANVDGSTRKTGKIEENKVPSFLFNPPIQVTSIVENAGNVHADATYVLQVFPLFGDEEIYTNEENPERKTILPETRRLNTISWDGAPQLGIFKVKQTVKFLDQTSVTEKIVFICPLWFLFIVLAIIFLAIFWIASRARSRRKEE